MRDHSTDRRWAFCPVSAALIEVLRPPPRPPFAGPARSVAIQDASRLLLPVPPIVVGVIPFHLMDADAVPHRKPGGNEHVARIIITSTYPARLRERARSAWASRQRTPVRRKPTHWASVWVPVSFSPTW